jgi:hypothetical protein
MISAEKARADVIQAVELVDSIRHLVKTLDNVADLPVGPISDALEVAMEEAYEAVTVWKAAVSDHRAVESANRKLGTVRRFRTDVP